MEALEIGTRVERVGSPPDTLVKDGAQGVVAGILQAENGALGYFVKFSDAPPTFCAGSRLKPVTA